MEEKKNDKLDFNVIRSKGILIKFRTLNGVSFEYEQNNLYMNLVADKIHYPLSFPIPMNLKSIEISVLVEFLTNYFEDIFVFNEDPPEYFNMNSFLDSFLMNIDKFDEDLRSLCEHYQVSYIFEQVQNAIYDVLENGYTTPTSSQSIN